MKKIYTLLISLLLAVQGFSQCPNPDYVNVYNVGKGIVNVNWQSLNSGSNYSIEYGPQGFETGQGITVTGSINEMYNSVEISGLANATTYEFRLIEDCSNGESTASNSVVVTTLSECADPAYYYASNTAVGTVEYYWQSYNQGGSYSLEYGPQGFASGEGTLLTGSIEQNNSVIIGGLQISTLYEFRLTENCLSGNTTEEVVTSINTLDDCPTPENFFGGNKAKGIVEVNWMSYNSGSTYTIEYGPEGFVSGEGMTVSGSISQMNMQAEIFGLESSTNYEFRLTEDCAGDRTTMEQTTVITTLSSCSDPMNVFTYYERKGELTLNWSSFNIGASYTVTYGPQGFEIPEGTLTGSIYEENNQITVTGLADATTYEFRVFESCLEGESSGVKTTLGTTLGSCPATSYLNVYNQSKGAVELYWNSYNPGSDYEIEYGLAGFTSGEGQTLTGVVSDEYMDVIISGLADETVYEFRLVESCGDNEFTSVVTNSMETLGPCPEVAYFYVENSGIGSVTVNWDTYNKGGSYTIEYGPAGFTPGTGTVLSGELTQSYMDVEISGLPLSSDYTFILKETCVNEDVTPEVSQTIKTLSECPDPEFFGLENYAVGAIKVEWASYNIGQTFTVYYGPEGVAENEIMEVTGTVYQRYPEIIIDGLSPSTNYYVELVENCSNGSSITVSDVITTVEECPSPGYFDDEYIGSTEVLLLWETYNLGQSYSIEYGLAGFTPGTGTVVNGQNRTNNDESSAFIGGLSPETAYDFYLTEQCANGGEVVSVEKVSVTTTASVPAPSNVDCANALPLSLGDNNGTLLGITGTNRPETCFLANPESRGVWYTYTATEDTYVKFDLCTGGATFDSQIEIYTGSCSNLSCLKSADDAADCSGPILTIPVTNGTTYYLFVSGYDYEEEGDFVLNVSTVSDYTSCVASFTEPTIFALDQSSAEVSWTVSAVGTYGYLLVGETGFIPFYDNTIYEQEFIMSETERSAVVYGLDNTKSYDVYIAEVCDSEEEYEVKGPYYMTTQNPTALYSLDAKGVFISNTGKILVHGVDNLNAENLKLHTILGEPVDFTLKGQEVIVNSSYSGVLLLSLKTEEKVIVTKIVK